MSEGGPIYDLLRNIPDDNVPGIGTLLNNVVTSQTGITTTGSSQDDALTALNASYSSLVGVTSTAKSLQTANDAQTATGASYSDLFERTSSSSLGTSWTVAYSGSGSGTLATADGHNAAWIIGSGDRRADAFYTPASGGFTLGDYQKVSIVLSTQPAAQPYSPFINPVNYIYGRANSAGTTYVYAAISKSGNAANPTNVEIGCVVSGTKTVWASNFCSTSTTFTLQCGTGNGVRSFSVLDAAGRVVVTFNDTSAVSQYGTSYRYGGFGFSANTPTGGQTGQQVPGAINSWTLGDATVTPTYGSFCMVSRAASTSANSTVTAGNPSVWANGWADTINYTSADIVYNTGLNISAFNVYTPGVYLLRARCIVSTGTISTQTYAGYYPTSASGSRTFEYSNTMPSTASVTRINDTALIYVPYADASHPAQVGHNIITSSSTLNITGGTANNGYETYQSLTRVSG